jgi:hypothetical protein
MVHIFNVMSGMFQVGIIRENDEQKYVTSVNNY